MAQFAVLYIVFLGIVGHFSKITQSAGSPSSAISPYKDMDLTSGLTSTSITAQKTVMLLHQILLQETSLRMDLEKTVRNLMNEFEQMKKNQMEVKKEQDIINQQLINNIASLRSENQQLKDELGQIVNNSFSTLGMQTCKCDLTNITSYLHDFKREVRQNVSFSLLEFQREMNSIKASILQTNDIRIGDISRDISNIQSAYKNLSSFIDSDRQLQASFNDDILVQQVNLSNLIKDLKQRQTIANQKIADLNNTITSQERVIAALRNTSSSKNRVNRIHNTPAPRLRTTENSQRQFFQSAYFRQMPRAPPPQARNPFHGVKFQ